MSQKLAPNIRLSFPLLALVFQGALVALFTLFVTYKPFGCNDETKFGITYAIFQDVNAVVFVGFGFLFTFLKRYGHSGLAFNLFLAGFAVQWAAFLEGALFGNLSEGIEISLQSLIRAEVSALSALISIGAVVGVTSPIQLLMMVVLELTCFVVDRWMLEVYYLIEAGNSEMYLHIFGAFFGLAASRILYRPGLRHGHEKEGSLPISELFSTIGSVFLWMLWPSFNSATLEGAERTKAVINTYYALAACSVAVFAVSGLVHPKGKIDMVHIRSATLSGGVAVGLSAPLIDSPCIAMSIGFTAGVVSVLGAKFLKSWLVTLRDSCGILYVHGLPGIVGAIVYIVLIALPSSAQRNAMNPFKESAALLITLASSLLTGFITGFILKLNIWKQPPDLKCYDDQAYWEFPHLAT